MIENNEVTNCGKNNNETKIDENLIYKRIL
jgi:hypothetical protein